MRLLDHLVPRRSVGALSLDEWAQFFQLGMIPATLNQTLLGNEEKVEATYAGLAEGAFRRNGIIFACMVARLMLFSEARFVWQQLRGSRPGDLFGTPELALLEEPEPGKQTGDLLTRAVVDVDLAGNYFSARRPGPRIKRMRPDWVTILLGARNVATDVKPYDLDAEFIGVIYVPGGPASGNEPETYLAEEICHWAPIPDPLASYRGMSWVLPIIREVESDQAATFHKLQYFNNAATPNMVVTLDPRVTIQKAREWIELFEQEHKGSLNAFKTAYLGGGAESKPVGDHLRNVDFRAVQGAGEVRIVNASGMHPVIVGVSEGLQGSALNSGNFNAARRLTSDKTMRPLWRGLAGSLQVLLNRPGASRLWYDVRDIPFLAEDFKDAAEVTQMHASAARSFSDGGWEPDAVIDAITSGDLRRLIGRHTGLLPVQVQKPGSEQNGSDSETGALALYQRVWQEPAPRARATGSVRSTTTFWPMSGLLTGRHIEAGTVVDAGDEIVSAFPQLFELEAVAAALGGGRAGPPLLISRGDVIAARERLTAAGQPAGYDSLARELNVSRETVRRRLSNGTAA